MVERDSPTGGGIRSRAGTSGGPGRSQPTIDLDAFPIVRITYPLRMTEADVDEYMVRLGEVLRRGRVGTVVDIRPLDPRAVGAAHRKYLAAAVDELTQAHPGRLAAEAIVMDSALLRGLYTAYCWVRRDSSYPSRAFADPGAAEAWLRGQLEERGVLPPGGGSGSGLAGERAGE